ncbi:WXG100 family type VII secretion target [Nocardia arthritidis]|uniref:PPE domain-containing protein n=1 Tax=Nocardia arthritidis TaxID=228602 RepID=A0A6G9Y6H5_9NOCA|nr:hypothetical protein [Nocardia arthritidis]QIS08811.1 PPE domain-containing protein [Nocardia arthritidis]
MTYDEYRARIIAAQEQWNKERSDIYAATSVLNMVFHGDIEPPTIPGTEPAYDTMKLSEMTAVVDQMRPAQVLQVAEAWHKISLSLSDAVSNFNQAFSKTLAGGWTGTSADAALSAVNTYSEQSRPLATATMLVADKLREMHTGLEQTQALMPRVSQRPDLSGKSLPQDGVMKAGDYTDEEAEKEGHRIFNTIYGQVAHQTDRGVPVLPNAPQIADSSGPPPVTPAPNDGGGPNPGGPHPDGADGGQPTDSGQGKPGGDNPNDKTGQQPGTQPTSVTPDSTQAASTTTSPAPTSTPSNDPSATAKNPSATPSAPNPASPTLSAPGTPSRPSPSRPTIPGTPRTPGTTPGTPKSPGAPGRSVSGTPQQPGVTPAAARGTNSTTARPGAAGTPFGGAPGAGKGKDDETTSGTKDYLINKRNGEEVTGLDSLPKAVPPVIGDVE